MVSLVKLEQSWLKISYEAGKEIEKAVGSDGSHNQLKAGSLADRKEKAQENLAQNSLISSDANGISKSSEEDTLVQNKNQGVTTESEEKRSSSNLRGRIGVGIKITSICLVSELFKTTLNLYQAMTFLKCAVIYRNLSSGNAQTTIMHAFEHARNITGIFGSIPMSIAFGPEIASEFFLVRKASKLQVKLNPQDAAKLYAIGYAVDKFFQKYNLSYRLCSGSILGAVRHKGIIPWDDDIDVFLHPGDIEKCRKLFETIFTKETGLIAQEQPVTGGWECFYPESPKGEGFLKDIGLPFIDVFRTVSRANTQSIHYEDINMQTAYSGEFFTEEQWKNAKRYEFGPTTMVGVEDPYPYIERAYGADALDFAYQTVHHDEINKLADDPLSIEKWKRTINQFGFPRRAVISDKSPIPYDENLYKDLVSEIDSKLEMSTNLEAAS